MSDIKVAMMGGKSDMEDSSNVNAPIDDALRFLIMAKRILDHWPTPHDPDPNAAKAVSVVAGLVNVAIEQLSIICIVQVSDFSNIVQRTAEPSI